VRQHVSLFCYGLAAFFRRFTVLNLLTTQVFNRVGPSSKLLFWREASNLASAHHRVQRFNEMKTSIGLRIEVSSIFAGLRSYLTVPIGVDSANWCPNRSQKMRNNTGTRATNKPMWCFEKLHPPRPIFWSCNSDQLL